MTGRSGRGVISALACMAALFAGVGASSAQEPPAASDATLDPGAALAHWTPDRMRHAPPLRLELPAPALGEGPAPTPGAPVHVRPALPGAPAAARLREGPSASASAFSPGDESADPNRIHGRVFGTYPGMGDYSCSGSVVNSPARSLIVTAGHCVFSGDAWATNWMFVPGYRDGNAPYGRWAAVQLRAAEQWVGEESISFDFGTAVVGRNRNGRGVQDVVGARGIAFDQPREQTYTSYGYPAEPPFDGESLQACNSPYDGSDENTDRPHPMRIVCDMTGGASGGGWVVDQTLLSVNSYCVGLVLVCAEVPPRLYGPYLSTDAKSLYLQSRGRANRCGKRIVTQLGGAGTQAFTGRRGRDVIHLGSGADSAAGRSGRDVLCGGAGNDVLRGGPGRDVCLGGRGRDTATGCEIRRRIP